MSDYYYFEDKEAKEGDFNFTPVLGEDYISALFSIARKHKVNITDELILEEIYQKKTLKKITNTYLYIDGTNLFAGQNELFGSLMTGDADLIYPLEVVRTLNIPTYAIFLPNRFSLEMAYKANYSFVLNFSSRFKTNRRTPKHLKVVSIKKPRMINIRGK